MIPRILQSQIESQLAAYPAVMIHGPRHVGKTTLANALAGKRFDMEDPQDCVRLDVEWVKWIKGKKLIILDEVQTIPEMFLRLRAVIDEDSTRKGRFLLISSLASPLTKSLTGRLATCELTPLLARETPKKQWDRLWQCGGFAEGGILDDRTTLEWHTSYLEQMVQRDLPDWGFPAPPRVTMRLLRMLAASHGESWNASRIAKSTGVTYHTINTYVDFLERAFLVRRLPAANVSSKKRLVKTPKLYIRDSGLLHALQGVTEGNDLLSQPWVGYGWEGWVIEQITGCLQAAGHTFTMSHFATSDAYAVDLLLDHQDKRWAIGISISSAPDQVLMSHLKRSAELINADHILMVSRTTDTSEYEGVQSLNLSATLDLLLK